MRGAGGPLEVQRLLPALLSLRGLVLCAGLHTGVAVVGRLGDATVAPYVDGEVVALATRLGHAAPAGAIVVSEATARLVRHLVPLEMLRPSPQPYLAMPLVYYQVQGLHPQRPPSRWGAGRPLTPLVGRTRELAVLHQAYEQAVAGQGQVVGLVGEPGLGKSRLLAEVRRHLQGQPVTMLTGYCLSYGRAIPSRTRRLSGLRRSAMAWRLGSGAWSSRPTRCGAWALRRRPCGRVRKH